MAAVEDDKVRLENESEQQQKDALIQPAADETKAKVPEEHGYGTFSVENSKSVEKSPFDIEGRLTGALAFAVFAATVGGSFQFGYNIGCVNAPQLLITDWIKSTTDADVKFIWSITVGIFAVGGMFGGLLCGALADKIGRKSALLVNNIFAIIGVLLMTSAKFAGHYYLLTIGRLIIGFNSGLNSGLVPMYVTEIAPMNLRGAIGSICQLLVTVSILVSQIIGLPFLLGTEERWPFIFAFSLVPVVVMLICLPLCPESPKYSLIVKNRKEQAEKDLIKLRSSNDVAAELELIEEEAVASRSQANVGMAEMFGAALRWPLFIAIMMMFAQQLSGINATMFYSTDIFKGAGLTGTGPVYATIMMGAINVFQTIVSVWLVEHPKFGRRLLMLVGMIGMFFACLFIVGSLTLANVYHYAWASYSAVVFVLLFVVSFATGPGSIPWFYVSEIFPSNARGNANSLACMANWLANFFVAVSFPNLNDILKHFTFLIFAGMLAVFIVFTYLFVPETKNKTVEEINREMYKRDRPQEAAAATAKDA